MLKQPQFHGTRNTETRGITRWERVHSVSTLLKKTTTSEQKNIATLFRSKQFKYPLRLPALQHRGRHGQRNGKKITKGRDRTTEES